MAKCPDFLHTGSGRGRSGKSRKTATKRKRRLRIVHYARVGGCRRGIRFELRPSPKSPQKALKSRLMHWFDAFFRTQNTQLSSFGIVDASPQKRSANHLRKAIRSRFYPANSHFRELRDKSGRSIYSRVVTSSRTSGLIGRSTACSASCNSSGVRSVVRAGSGVPSPISPFLSMSSISNFISAISLT